MINSVHLQDFPDVSKIKVNSKLVDEMDLVKEICSVALFLRSRENLRVRLPLNYIKIISKDVDNIKKYSDIISDEVNTKQVIFDTNIDNYANFVIEVNLKLLGPKYGSKFKDIMKDVKENSYKLLNDGKVEVAGVILDSSEYTIKLKPKVDSKNIQPLSNNKTLIELDFNITENLELEGYARDIVRIIQQKRKDANLNLSDRISLILNLKSQKLIKAIENNIDYIKLQTLSKSLQLNQNTKESFSYVDSCDNEDIEISFSVIG